MEHKENEVWEIRYWIAESYQYSTSERCLKKVRWDNTICYDPLSHETHPCKKELCPVYYEGETNDLNNLKKKL